MSCQQVPTAPALKPYPRSVQVGEFEVAISGGVWVAIRAVGFVDTDLSYFRCGQDHSHVVQIRKAMTRFLLCEKKRPADFFRFDTF